MCICICVYEEKDPKLPSFSIYLDSNICLLEHLYKFESSEI